MDLKETASELESMGDSLRGREILGNPCRLVIIVLFQIANGYVFALDWLVVDRSQYLITQASCSLFWIGIRSLRDKRVC